MPENVKLIKIFVASPCDVRDEREVVDDVVKELNCTFYQKQNIRLEVIKQETHTRPGVGQDPQDVINQQIKDYDIFVGIMWARIGTRTGRAISGTVEEFENAYEKHKNGEDIKIAFYFKKEPVGPFEVDEMQLQKVKTFRSELETLGCYYFPFKELKDFEGLIRSHLNSYAVEICANKEAIFEVEKQEEENQNDNAIKRIYIKEEKVTPEVLLQIVENNLSTYGQLMSDVGQQQVNIGLKIRNTFSVANRIHLKKYGKPISEKLISDFSNLGKDLSGFKKNLDGVMDDFVTGFNALVDALSRLISHYPLLDGIPQKKIASLFQKLEEMLGIYDYALGQGDDYIDSLQYADYITPEANHAKRELYISYKLFLTELDEQNEILSSVVEAFNKMKDVLEDKKHK